MSKSIAPAMEDENQKIPSLPPNYVTLQQLQERRIREQLQKQRQKEDQEERRKLRESEEEERKRKKEEEEERKKKKEKEEERKKKKEEERERIQKEEEERKRIQNEGEEKERKTPQKPVETLATGATANWRYKNSRRTRLEGGKDKLAAGSEKVEVPPQDLKIEESAKKHRFRKRYNTKSKQKFATEKMGDLPENIPEVEIQIPADNPPKFSEKEAGDPSRNCPKSESRRAVEDPHVSLVKIATGRGNNRTVEIVGKIEDLTIVATEKVVEPEARLKLRIRGNRVSGIMRRDKCVYGDANRTAENASKIGDGTADGKKDREIHGGNPTRGRWMAAMKDENRRTRVSSEELGLGSGEKDGEIHGGKARAGMRDNYRRARVSSEEFNGGSSRGLIWVKKEEISGRRKVSSDRCAIAGGKGTGKTIRS